VGKFGATFGPLNAGLFGGDVQRFRGVLDQVRQFDGMGF
jgi:hypothetical protein